MTKRLSTEAKEEIKDPRAKHALPPPLGFIEVIHAALIGTSLSRCKGVLSVVLVENPEGDVQPEKKLRLSQGPIEFGDKDLEGMTQPHDDTFVVTARIDGFMVKRVLIDQGSWVEVMYHNLYKGLRLKTEDLSKYDTPLVGIDDRMVIPKGQISLSVNT